MPDLNNSPKNSPNPKSWHSIQNLNLKLKRKTLKSESKNLKITRLSLTLNGKLSTINFKKLWMQEHKSYSPNYPSEISPHNSLLTEIFSALEELPMKTFKESPNLLELLFKPPLTESKALALENVENLKKSRSELKGKVIELQKTKFSDF